MHFLETRKMAQRVKPSLCKHESPSWDLGNSLKPGVIARLPSWCSCDRWEAEPKRIFIQGPASLVEAVNIKETVCNNRLSTDS